MRIPELLQSCFLINCKMNDSVHVAQYYITGISVKRIYQRHGNNDYL